VWSLFLYVLFVLLFLSSASEPSRARSDLPCYMNANALRLLWRGLVLVVGLVVLVIGCALMVLPGPAFLVIPAGLAILALEFEWARRWLKRVKQVTSNTLKRRRHRSTAD
jgi:tellurite resistance protein TerC